MACGPAAAARANPSTSFKIIFRFSKNDAFVCMHAEIACDCDYLPPPASSLLLILTHAYILSAISTHTHRTSAYTTNAPATRRIHTYRTQTARG